MRRAAPFPHVAAQAGTDDILPVGQSAAAAGDDVIEAELLGRKAMPAVLAAVLVAEKDIPPVELHHVLGVHLVPQQANDARHLDLEIDGPDPVFVLPASFELGLELAG